MFKGVSRAAGFALSLLATAAVSQAGIPMPDQCTSDCSVWAMNQECQNWFGAGWFYCGYSDGWVYCCSW